MSNVLKRCVFLGLGTFTMMTVFITVYTVAKTVSNVKEVQVLQLMKQDLVQLDRGDIRKVQVAYLIDQPGCKIPNYQAHSDDAKEHVDTIYDPTPCSGKPFLFDVVLNPDTDTACIMIYDHVLQKYYADVKLDEVACTYEEALRDTGKWVIDSHHKRGPKKNLSLPIACIPEEYVWISCLIGTAKPIAYHQPILLPVVKPVKKSGTGTPSGHQRSKKPPFNVIILGIDALSRLAVHRTMPKTLQWLKSKPESVVELLGYSKVGLNSAPNIFALLTGISFTKYLKPKLEKYARYADGLTRYLWEDFADAGYRTMFLEEQGEYGIFVYPDFSGFKEVPVNHWPKPLMYLINAEAKKTSNVNYCIGPELRSSLYLDYTYNMLKLHGSERPLWAFTWLSILSHGGHKRSALLDQPVTEFLTKLDNDGILNRSIIVFAADHGFRHGKFRETEQGRLEDSLPFGFVILPPPLVAEHPIILQRLKTNSRRLVTAYDLRKVLLDILEIQNPALSRSQEGLGTSLIRHEIDGARTCDQAGIPYEYCPCSSREIYNDTELAVMIGNKAVSFLNDVLKNASHSIVSNSTHACSLWNLESVAQLTYTSIPSNVASMFQVNMITQPKATFEVTVTVTQSTWILNEVTRIDRYGIVAACATGRIQQYCYCIKKAGAPSRRRYMQSH